MGLLFWSKLAFDETNFGPLKDRSDNFKKVEIIYEIFSAGGLTKKRGKAAANGKEQLNEQLETKREDERGVKIFFSPTAREQGKHKGRREEEKFFYFTAPIRSFAGSGN